MCSLKQGSSTRGPPTNDWSQIIFVTKIKTGVKNIKKSILNISMEKRKQAHPQLTLSWYNIIGKTGLANTRSSKCRRFCSGMSYARSHESSYINDTT